MASDIRWVLALCWIYGTKAKEGSCQKMSDGSNLATSQKMMGALDFENGCHQLIPNNHQVDADTCMICPHILVVADQLHHPQIVSRLQILRYRKYQGSWPKEARIGKLLPAMVPTVRRTESTHALASRLETYRLITFPW
jgi:hypothetical protein